MEFIVSNYNIFAIIIVFFLLDIRNRKFKSRLLFKKSLQKSFCIYKYCAKRANYDYYFK